MARLMDVELLMSSRHPMAAEAQGMLASGWTEQMLIRFRAGAEAVISAAKRGVNLARCLWRKWDGFCMYMCSVIAAHNPKMMISMLK